MGHRVVMGTVELTPNESFGGSSKHPPGKSKLHYQFLSRDIFIDFVFSLQNLGDDF